MMPGATFSTSTLLLELEPIECFLDSEACSVIFSRSEPSRGSFGLIGDPKTGLTALTGVMRTLRNVIRSQLGENNARFRLTKPARETKRKHFGYGPRCLRLR